MEQRLQKAEDNVKEIKSLLVGHLDDEKSTMTGIHKMLERQNEVMDTFHKKVDAHIERVEPVIKAYEDTKIFNEELSRKGGVIIKAGGIASAIGAVWFLLVHGLK